MTRRFWPPCIFVVLSLVFCWPFSVSANKDVSKLTGTFSVLGIETEAAKGAGIIEIRQGDNGQLRIHGTATIRSAEGNFQSAVRFQNVLFDPSKQSQTIACVYKYEHKAGKDLRWTCKGNTAVLVITPEQNIVITCRAQNEECVSDNAFNRFYLVKAPNELLELP